MTENTAVGFIGLGVMGEPMCRNLIRKFVGKVDNEKLNDSQSRLSVFDLQPARAARFAKLGAKVCHSVREIAQASDVILLSLPGGDELEQVLLSDDGLFAHALPGTTIVDLSTSPVELTRSMAAQARERGFHYVDSPVARTRKAAEEGTLAMSVGGSKTDVERVRPILECMATEVLHVGDSGCGQLVKILNNMVLFQTVNALAEAKVLATRSGMDVKQLFDALQQGSANSFALQQHGRNALQTDDFPEQTFSVSYARKDLRYALELAIATETKISGAEHIDQLFQSSINNGDGEKYWPVIVNLLQK